MKLGVMLLPQRRTQAPAVMVTNLTEREAIAARLITVKMGTALIVRNLMVKTAIVRNALTAVTALTVRVLIRMRRMATALSVLIIPTVLTVPAITVKAATAPNALTVIMPAVTVLTVPAITAKAATHKRVRRNIVNPLALLAGFSGEPPAPGNAPSRPPQRPREARKNRLVRKTAARQDAAPQRAVHPAPSDVSRKMQGEHWRHTRKRE